MPSDATLSTQEIAERIIDAWEQYEGESMRDGHRATMERLIMAALASEVEPLLRQRDDAERLCADLIAAKGNAALSEKARRWREIADKLAERLRRAGSGPHYFSDCPIGRGGYKSDSDCPVCAVLAEYDAAVKEADRG